MDYKRKASLRREMLGCAREARYQTSRSMPMQARMWNDKAAEFLMKLGGLLGNW